MADVEIFGKNVCGSDGVVTKLVESMFLLEHSRKR